VALFALLKEVDLIRASQTTAPTKDFTEPADEVLIALFYDGNDDALETLIKRYNGRLYAFAKAHGLDHDAAQEQTHLTFVKVYLGLEKKNAGLAGGWYDESKGVKFSTWLYTLQHNNCMDVLRHRGRDFLKLVELDGEADADALPMGDGLSIDVEGPLQSLILAEEKESKAKAVRNAVERLSPRQRFVLELRVYLDEERDSDEDEVRTLQEISEITGLSLTTVHRELKRGLENLQTLLMEEDIFMSKEESDVKTY